MKLKIRNKNDGLDTYAYDVESFNDSVNVYENVMKIVEMIRFLIYVDGEWKYVDANDYEPVIEEGE